MNWYKELRIYLGLSIQDFSLRKSTNPSYFYLAERTEGSIVDGFNEICDFFCVNCKIQATVKMKNIEVSSKENFFTHFRKVFNMTVADAANEICKELGHERSWFYNAENTGGYETNTVEKLIVGLGGNMKIKFTPFTPNQLAARRFEAVKRHQNGESHRKIAPDFGVHFTTIGEWCASYEKHGVEGLKNPLKIRPNRKINLALLKRTYEAETNPEKRGILESLLELAKTKSLTQTAQKYNISTQALAKRRKNYLKDVGVI